MRRRLSWWCLLHSSSRSWRSDECTKTRGAEAQAGTLSPTEQAVRDVRGEIRREVWEGWRSHLLTEDQIRGHRAVRSVLPNWEAWRDRGGLPLSLRTTLVLAGHGVFEEYLKKIGREMTSTCHHCGEGEDTAQHTLEFCPAWEAPCRILRLTIDERLNPSSVVKAMLRGRQELLAVRLYCEGVMLVKERTERERVRTSHPGRVLRRRTALRRPR